MDARERAERALQHMPIMPAAKPAVIALVEQAIVDAEQAIEEYHFNAGDAVRDQVDMLRAILDAMKLEASELASFALTVRVGLLSKVEFKPGTERGDQEDFMDCLGMAEDNARHLIRMLQTFAKLKEEHR